MQCRENVQGMGVERLRRGGGAEGEGRLSEEVISCEDLKEVRG